MNYAYEVMLCLHVFRQTGSPRRIDYLALPPIFWLEEATTQMHVIKTAQRF